MTAMNDSLFERLGTEETICSNGDSDWNERLTLWSTLRGVEGYETATIAIYNGHVSALGQYELDRREVEALRDALTELLEDSR